MVFKGIVMVKCCCISPYHLQSLQSLTLFPSQSLPALGGSRLLHLFFSGLRLHVGKWHRRNDWNQPSAVLPSLMLMIQAFPWYCRTLRWKLWWQWQAAHTFAPGVPIGPLAAN